jgi:Galactosyltransferase.
MIAFCNKVRMKTLLHLILAQALFSCLYIVTIQSHLPSFSGSNSTNSNPSRTASNSSIISSTSNDDTSSGASAAFSAVATSNAAGGNRSPATSSFNKDYDMKTMEKHQSLSDVSPFETDASAGRTWIAKSPWDAPPPDFYSPHATGSFQNCTHRRNSSTETLTTIDSSNNEWDPPVMAWPSSRSISSEPPLISSGSIMISCHRISFKAPSLRLYNAGPLIIGILSAASGSGPKRRNYIRSTWASSQYTNGTFFLVAGPWEDIRNEFEFYKDIIWIDEEEIYQGEKSVLTYKTISYFAIAHMFGAAPAQDEEGVTRAGWQHAIKTDDDSYVNLKLVEEKLIRPQGEFHKLHYYGQCPQFQVKPSRDKTNKWPVTYQTYPEPEFPLYCQGAGFGLSRELVRTAVEGGHVENFRYMPFEDVSIGILAERCGRDKFHATMIPGVRVFRADTKKERDCVNRAIPMTECYKGDDSWPPDARMSHHLIQHRVDDRDDMISIHKSLGLDVHWVKTLNGR